jgi:DNA-binding SARP family transcriptional activator
MQDRRMRVDVRMLGGFEVEVDGAVIDTDAFAQRRGADLVKLLALAPGHRLARDQAIELLWPRLTPEAGAANLHKAAHHARRALGARDAVVLAGGVISLAPDGAVTTDVERFEAGDGSAYRGELLPDDRYEQWCATARERVRGRRVDGLRAARRWEAVLEEDPADEHAHRELMRADLAAGDRVGAARRFGELRDALARLGLTPSPDTLDLYREAGRGEAVTAPRALRGPVAGRDAALAEAVGALRRAGDGDGTTLLVTAEIGMGKTRFAEALLQGAERRGMHTLRGAARGTEGRVPYGPVVEALDPLLRRRPDLLARLGAGSRAAMAMLSPAAGTVGPPAPVQRHRVLTAIAHLLHEAAAERGVVLVLEDLQAADEATLRLVDFLSVAAHREPLILVATARPAAPASTKLWRALRARRAATEVVLGPLDDGAIREIVARAARTELPPEAIDRLVEAAAGNPFYAVELAAAGGTVRLREVCEAALAALGAEAGALLPALTVLDDGAGVGEVAAVAGVRADTAERGLATAAVAGVLEERDGGWGFRHPLLREAARRSVGPMTLARTHGRAARYLAQAGGAPERIARHLLEAGRGAEAVPWLRAAAARAADVGAYVVGRRWVEQALAHARPEDQGALYALLGDLEAAAGALDELPEGTPTQQARAAILLGFVAWFRGDVEAAAEHVERAGALEAAGAGDVERLIDLRAMVAHARGRLEAHSTWEITEGWHIPQLAGRVFDGYLCVTEYALQAGRPEDGLIAFARELHAAAERSGARRGQAFASTVLGEALLLTGDLPGARRHLHDAARLSREVAAPGGEALARARLGEALAAAGEQAEATAQLEEALELAHASALAPHLLYLVHAARIRTVADSAVALAAVDAAETILAGMTTCRFGPVVFQVAAAGACARGGAPERGEAYVQAAVQGARLWPAGLWSPAISEARADLALVAGDRGGAEVLLRRALTGFAASGQRLHEARMAARLSELESTAPAAR